MKNEERPEAHFHASVCGADVAKPHVIAGVETVIVVSCAEYNQMALTQKKLSVFFRESPLVGVDIDLIRGKDGREADIDL